ncbi:MAG: dihydrolipoamide acetyltransferase family protein [Lettuce witches'-broom phytoplasma]
MTNNNDNVLNSTKEAATNNKNTNNNTEDVEIQKISRLRKIIAKKMSISKTVIPEVTLMDEVDITNLVALRTQMKPLAKEKGIKLTYMAFIAKAVILALKEYPIFNASFDDEKEELIIKNYINLGIAIDTKDGLIVPNIKNVDNLSVLELAKEIHTLSVNTVGRKLQLSQLQKGTFTLSNFGAIDIAYGTPIINHPELAILGIGKIVKKPIVKKGEIVVADMLPLSLAIDHRIIDGADGGRLLQKIKALLNDVKTLENDFTAL